MAIAGFFGWWHSCNQPAQDVDKAVDGRAMARMLNLRDVLQLVNDGFDNRALAEQQPVVQGHQSLFHVAFELGDELNACGFQQLFCQLLRDIAFVSKYFAEQLLQQLWNGDAVIGVAGREHDIEQFSSVIDDQMQFEAKKPIDRGFAACR
jgi:hypothetical protein